MVKSVESPIITILKASTIATLVFYLVYVSVLTSLALPFVNEQLQQLIDSSHDNQDSQQLQNVVKFSSVSLISVTLLVIISGIIATIVESVPLLFASCVVLFSGLIVKIIYISGGDFMPLSLSLPLMLIELISVVLTLALASKLCARRCTLSNYVSGLFDSL